VVVITWTTDSGDSQGKSVNESLDVLRGIKAPKHEVILMHEVYQEWVDVREELLKRGETRRKKLNRLSTSKWHLRCGEVKLRSEPTRCRRERQSDVFSLASVSLTLLSSTVQKLVPQGIPILKKNGYKNFVTVAEGLSLNPYKVQGAHGSRDSSWTCDGQYPILLNSDW